MRVTTKGQVTIPRKIREELGLLPNTEVDFEIVDGEARLRKARRRGKVSRGDGVVADLRGVRPSNKLTTDEIMALMRGVRTPSSAECTCSRATQLATGRTFRR